MLKKLFGTFSGLLTVLFVVLKLTHVVDWSWVWVLAPLWLGFAVNVLLWLGALVLGASLFKSNKE